jgi:hypothetical protein
MGAHEVTMLVWKKSLCVALTALFGCGGSVASVPAGDHDAEPGPSDAGGDVVAHDAPVGDGNQPWSPVCPDTIPAIGSACTQENLECEYGSAWWNISCDKVVQCQSGAWTSFMPSYDPCSPAPGPNPAGCPANLSDIPQGGSCEDTTLSCDYLPNAICSCSLPLGGPVQVDAGGSWACLPEQGCPLPRPTVGTACDTENQMCTYQQCSYAQTCEGGVWQAQLEACAAQGL